jgi:hypothetical protein
LRREAFMPVEDLPGASSKGPQQIADDLKGEAQQEKQRKEQTIVNRPAVAFLPPVRVQIYRLRQKTEAPLRLTTNSTKSFPNQVNKEVSTRKEDK